MELLKEIYESELGFGEGNAESNRHGGQFWFSRVAVGVLYNDEYNVALIRHEDGRVELPVAPLGANEDLMDLFKRGI